MELFIKAIILGIIQGLTEFLPVSSSGHIEIGKALFNADFEEDNLTFTIIVHIATVLSTIVVFRKDILSIFKSLLAFPSKNTLPQLEKAKVEEDLKFSLYILISMIPVFVVGMFFKDFVEQFFDGRLPFVGMMLLITGSLLLSTSLIKDNRENLSPLKSFLIGIAQAIAVMPGISRSGATIATGLLLKVDKSKMARFSFLMVIPPILGMLLLDVKKMMSAEGGYTTEPIVLIAAFIAAFLTGLLACTWMIEIVKKGKIQYFAYYCFVVGLIAISTLWF